MTDVSPEEVARREQYWFEHWEQFTCEVVVSSPVSRSIRAGMFFDPFFGSIPIPFHGQEIDRGPLYLRNSFITVLGMYTTFAWPIQDVLIIPLDDGIEVRQLNRPVYTIRGPIRAAIAGALHAHHITLQS